MLQIPAVRATWSTEGVTKRVVQGDPIIQIVVYIIITLSVTEHLNSFNILFSDDNRHVNKQNCRKGNATNSQNNLEKQLQAVCA